MILRRQKKFTIQMREYETYSFGADVELSHHDIGYTDEQVAAMTEKEYADMREALTLAVQEELLVQLRDDLDRTAELVENRRSFARRANHLIEVMTPDSPKPKPQPASAKAKGAR